MHRADPILNVDPAHPLAAAAKVPAYTQPKRRQHLPERAAVAGEHDTRADLDATDARVDRRLRRTLPLPANICEEARARRTALAQELIRPVAVVTDCRSGDQ